VSRGLAVGPVAVVVRRRGLLAASVTLAATVGLVALSVFTGTLDLPSDRIWAALSGDGTRIENLVVLDRRLTRALAAVLVGFALGCAGALTQSITRNPIATPDILGVTTGASLFAVILVTRPSVMESVGQGDAGRLLTPAALVGGLLTTACILGLSWRAGFDGLRLILVGISVNAIALGAISWLLTRSELEEAAVATRWLTGSITGARTSDLALLGPVVLLGAVACTVLAQDLAALRLGREVAPTLGTPAGRTEAVSLLVAVVLVSAAAAVAGPVAFVAFVAPQAAMRLFGTAGPPALAGGLLGAVLLLGADLVAQRLPVELPVGVLTAIIGAPYLLFLLVHHVRRESV
jgi:iron complex transport system permease protein